MSNDLYEKTEALLKALRDKKADSMRTAAVAGQSLKTPKLPSKLPDVKPPKIKGPTLPKISTTPPKPKGLPTSPQKAAEAIKVPGALPPPSKKDPAAVAAQLKSPDQTKLVNTKEEVLKVESNGQWSLSKAVLDPSHGITFEHEHHALESLGDCTHIRAMHPEHGEIGEALLSHKPDGTLEEQFVDVHPNFRRMGVASAMYGHAENLLGKKVTPSPLHTPMGNALWAGNQAKPQFGQVAEPASPPLPKNIK